MVGEEVETWLVDDGDDFAEEDVNEALAFLHDDVEAEEAEEAEQDRDEDKETDAGEDGREEEGAEFEDHGFISKMMCWALP